MADDEIGVVMDINISIYTFHHIQRCQNTSNLV